jgi:phage gp36-like protein
MAQQEYATATDMTQLGISAAAVSSLDADTQTAHRLKASARVATFLRKVHTLPFDVVPDEVTEYTVAIAQWTMLLRRGFNPESNVDATIRERYLDAIKDLERIASGAVELEPGVDATPNVEEAGPLCESEEKHEWLFGVDALAAGEEDGL